VRFYFFFFNLQFTKKWYIINVQIFSFCCFHGLARLWECCLVNFARGSPTGRSWRFANISLFVTRWHSAFADMLTEESIFYECFVPV
jgi:hypothetical protein